MLSGALRKKLQGYVGFANLPNQVHRKSVKKGFNFTIMVVGKHSGNQITEDTQHSITPEHCKERG